MKQTFTFLSYKFLLLSMLLPCLLSAQAIGDYRSVTNGDWSVSTTWASWNGSAWVATATIPSSASGLITIQSGHVVTISTAITIDQTVVDVGGKIKWINAAGVALTIANGAGVDLTVNGTFVDSAALAIAFNASASWELGTTATFIKCGAPSNANWHSNYQGGSSMAAIPATSNWIVRKTGASNPPFSNAGLTYGNLFIENNAAGALTLTASGGTPLTIKGNFDIGGAGTTTVNFNNSNTTTTQVQGNMILRSGKNYTGTGLGINVQGTLDVSGTFNNSNASVTSIQGLSTITGTFNNNGTATANLQGGTTVNGTFNNTANATANLRGTTNINNTYSNIGTTTVQGDLQINGNWTYTGTTSQLNFTGSNSQLLGGGGTLQVYKLTMNKSSNSLVLNRPVVIDNGLVLTQGKIISTTTNIVRMGTNSGATVTSPSTNNSFVEGPIHKDNTSAGFTFPVGKGSNYQPLTISATAGGSFGTFWTEDFGTSSSCASGQNTRVINHINVATGMPWTETITTDGGAANMFFVSSTEAGMGVGNCGDGCLNAGKSGLNNQTLHIGNQQFSPVACFVCPTGDCGAAYDAAPPSGFCSPEFSPVTDRIAESPAINCTGHSNILLSFNYLEGGEGSVDNGQVWYFDGSTWALLSDMAKTPSNCGGASTWTAFSINLPASANNNPNVKIGFRWTNDANNVGTDPSLAIDDVALSETAPAESFRCEYFVGNPQTTFGTAKDATIADITTVEYWILDRIVGTANKQVTLNWDSPSNITTPSGTQVIRWDGSQWRDHTNGGTTGVASNAGGCTSQSTCGNITSGTMVTSFSPFTFGIPEVVTTPIELLSFEAQLEQRKTHIQWATATELNTSHFIVEKSRNAIDFEDIGRVAAVGNSIQTQHYQLYDNNLQEGVSYYRLRAVDMDGTFEHSRIVSVNYQTKTQEIRVFPNPTKSKLYLYAPSLTFEVLDIKITDIMGRILESRSLQYNTDTYEISMEHLPAGTYFVQFIYQGKAFTEKIIKQ